MSTAVQSTLQQNGLQSGATSAPVPGWYYVDAVGGGGTASATLQQVNSIASAATIEFVSPVFADDLGGDLLITQDILVQFKSGVSWASAESILQQAGAGTVLAKDWKNLNNAYCCRPAVQNGLDVLAIANALAMHPDVEFAEPDVIFSGQSSLIPDDAGFANVWGVHNTGQSGVVQRIRIWMGLKRGTSPRDLQISLLE